ncbi:MAG: cysteine hydrolase family protein [Propylenella sp.]
MTEALIALHFQNDICHPEGRVPFSLNRETEEASAFFSASAEALERARGDGLAVIHVHIAFAEDYSDLPRNCRLFRAVEERGALKRGSWGSEAFAGFAPKKGEIVVIHNRNSAFRKTDLEAELRKLGIARLSVMGLATQFSVEHTVRDAADMGFVVTVLSACCASADRDAHRASLKTMSMLAEIA